jgi:plastocyanin
MSQNGILDFQNTDKVRFIGASSNLILDTVNSSLGIGLATDDLLKSNLQIVGNAHITAGLTTLGNVAGDKFLGDGSLLTGVALPSDVAALSLDAVAGVNSATDETIQLTNNTTALQAFGNVSLEQSQLIFKAGGAASPATEWTYETAIDGSDTAGLYYGNDNYGCGVHCTPDGTRIIVAASDAYLDDNKSKGRVQVFDWNGSGWDQVGQTLSAINEHDKPGKGMNHMTQAGQTVAISADGTTVAFGAMAWTSVHGTYTGYALVYRLVDGVWTRLVGIEQPVGTGGTNGPIVGELYGQAQFEFFGSSLALSSDGNRVVIGAPGHNSSRGCARVFDWNGSNWVLVTTFNGDDSEAERSTAGWASTENFYGLAVDISHDGSVIAIGGPGRNSSQNTLGFVDVYHYDGSAWVKRNIGAGGAGTDGGAGTSNSLINASIVGIQTGKLFGWTLRLTADGKDLIVGAPTRSSSVHNWNDGLTTPTSDNSTRTGSASIFTYDAATDSYSRVGAELFSSTHSHSYASMQVDIDSTGDWLVMGQPNDNAGSGGGIVTTFQKISGTWHFFDTHVISNNEFPAIPGQPRSGFYLGKTVAMGDGGAFLHVGATGDNNQSEPNLVATFTNGYGAPTTVEVPVEMVSTTLTVHGNLQATSFLGDGTQLTGVALATDLADNSSRIDTLSNEINNLDIESALARSNLATDLADNSSRIDTLRVNLIDNSSRIVLTNADVADNASRVTVLETDLADNASRVTILEDANTVQATLLSTLRTDVDNFVVAQQQAGGDQSLNLADNAARITVLETDLADNSSRLDAQIAHADAANTVQAGLIDDLRTDVDSNANRVSFITAAGETTVIASNLDVTGNIFFRGERFVVDSETKVISDPVLGIANNNTLSTTDIGLVMQRPEANVALVHHGSADATNPDQFTIGYTQSSVEDSEITIDTGNSITVNILGDLITQDTITATTFVGDGTQLTGVALEVDLADNASRVSVLETDLADNSSRLDAHIAHEDAANTVQAGLIDDLRTDVDSNSTRLAELTFDDVVGVSNVSSNTIRLTNADTGLVVTGDIVVGETITSTAADVSNAATFGARKTFTLIESAGSYVIDGDPAPELVLSQGQTYVFDTSSGSLATHTLAFSTGADGGGSAYTNGITTTGTQGNSGAKTTFAVPIDATGVIYYYCTAHSGMGGLIRFTSAAHVAVTGNVEATAFIGDGTRLTGVAFPSDVGALTLGAVTAVGSTTNETIQLTNNTLALESLGNVSLEESQLIFKAGGGAAPATAWTYETAIDGSDTAGTWSGGDNYGCGVHCTPDGTRMIVAASDAHLDDNSYKGRVQVFDWNGSGWDQVGQTMSALAAYDRPGKGLVTSSGGQTVAISADGNTVAFGMQSWSSPSTSSSTGYVLVYRLVDGVWTRLDGGSGDPNVGELYGEAQWEFYGSSVALSSDGDRLVVGAPGHNDQRGRARVYDWNGSTWVLVTTFNSNDYETERTAAGWQTHQNFFGIAVDISHDGSVIAVGGPGRIANEVTKGYVDVYHYDGSAWVKRNSGGSMNVSVLGVQNSSAFGHALRLSGDGSILAVAASRRANMGSGRVFTYDAVNDSFSATSDLLPSSATMPASSSMSIDIDSNGEWLALGFPLNNDGSGGGAIYVYQKVAGTWTLFDHVISNTEFPAIPGDPRADFYLGRALALADGGAFLHAGAKNAGSTTKPNLVATFTNGYGAPTLVELPLEMLADTKLKIHGNVEANYYFGDGTQLTLPDFAFETDLADNSSRIDQLITDVNSLEVATTQAGGDTALNLADNAARIGVLETDVSDLRIDVDSNAQRVTYITSTPETTIIGSNLDVTGNIFFRGDRFVVDSETKVITDPIIGLANNNTLSSTDIGFVMQRPTANVALIHHGDASATNAGEFTIGYTQDSLEAAEVTVDTGNAITVNVLGDLITQDTVTATRFVGDGSGLSAFAFHIEASGGNMLDTKPVMNDTNTTLTVGFDHSVDESNASAGFITTTGLNRGMYIAPSTGVYSVSCRVRLTDYVSADQTVKWYIKRTDGTEEEYEHFELFVTPGSGLHATTSTTVVKLVQGEAIYPRGDGADSSISSATFSGQYIGTY